MLRSGIAYSKQCFEHVKYHGMVRYLVGLLRFIEIAHLS